MNQKEIFNLLANGIIDAIPQGIIFQESTLNIMRQEGVVEFNSFLLDEKGQKVNLEINMGYKYAKAVLELYQITQNDHPLHKDWNRAKYTLYPDGKMSIEYIWDQELQDRVDSYNKGL
jgi:hypothetical protein